jgi:hypothetical protein
MGVPSQISQLAQLWLRWKVSWRTTVFPVRWDSEYGLVSNERRSVNALMYRNHKGMAAMVSYDRRII